MDSDLDNKLDLALDCIRRVKKKMIPAMRKILLSIFDPQTVSQRIWNQVSVMVFGA